jgi:hypothetical protein
MNGFLNHQTWPLQLVFFLSLSLIGTSGCQSVRVVSQSESGGVIAIPANNDMWPFHYRSKAEALLVQQCPEGYVIELEEEFVTGQTTNVQEDHRQDEHQISQRASFTVESTNTTATTSDVKEWRIYYRKRSADDETENAE